MQTTKCRKCSSDLPENSRFCLSCGTPVEADTLATQTVAASAPVSSAGTAHSRLRGASSTSASDGRFLPGTLLAERYRIIAKLGQGGMGEVYRADDLVLGQAVALKFLPREATNNPQALDRFRNEVRIARQVSHPNVCRVYDLGEIDGSLYLSMEYVDGEDLGVLLRRIGRLPEAKALEISRKLCAGLAAAHEKGVLHRDLKPGNIMLDSHGQVLITDFGLAALAGQVEGAEVRNGTPAYMAPEQLDGKEVTVRSEIYSLGLVLYEIFTGKRPFESATLADLVRTRNESAPASPSTLVPDLDESVERVILRCMERDPTQRPSSALAVAAALPGGDPLAAALAAGETPSPQMVAAAGDISGLSPRIAIGCLAFVVVGMIAAFLLGPMDNLLDAAGSDTSPEILTHRARMTLDTLGYPKGADSVGGFYFEADALDYEEKKAGAKPDFKAIFSHRPRPLIYWYRESPQPMVPETWHDDVMTPGVPQEGDPPMNVPGMTLIMLDDQSRMIFFRAVPPQKTAPGATTPPHPMDWDQLFKLSELDPAQFKKGEPVWTPPTSFDERQAWDGVYPGTSIPLHIEAAAWQGKPVYFNLVGPWTKASSEEVFSASMKVRIAFLLVIGITMLIVPGWLAWRNINRGKADRRGALRLSGAVFCAQMLIWFFRGHFVAALGLYGLLVEALATSMLIAAIVWTVYLALEPYVRRHWPHSIISWSRLLNGKFRDPAVGRDVLYGVAMGTLWRVINDIDTVISHAVGVAPGMHNSSFLEGTRSVLAAWAIQFPSAIRGTLLFFFMLFILRVLLRNKWIAAGVFVAIWSVFQTLASSHPLIDGPAVTAIYLIAAVALVRFGLVTLAVAVFTTDSIGNLPITFNPSIWYFWGPIFVMASVILLAVWGFRAATAGRKLIAADLFE